MGVTSLTNPFTITRDGVYVNIAARQRNATGGLSSSRCGMVGTGSWGDTNTPLPFGDDSSLYSSFGLGDGGAHSLITEGLGYLEKGTDALGVRVTDGTDVPAVISVRDAGTALAPGTVRVRPTLTQLNSIGAAGAAAVQFQVKGSDNNPYGGITATAQSTAVPTTLAAQLQELTTELAASFTGQLPDPLGFFTGCVAGADVAGPYLDVSFTTANNATHEPAGVTNVGLVVTLTAANVGHLTAAVDANATTPAAAVIVNTAVCTGTDGNNTAARVDKGSKWTATSPTARYTLIFNGITETWDNLPAYTAAGAGYDKATLQASIVAAVNNGTAQRAKSRYFTAAAAPIGAATALPQYGVAFDPTMTGGTKGTNGSNVTHAQLVGADAPTAAARKGMYALTGGKLAGLILCGQTDLTVSAEVKTFCRKEGGTIPFFSVPAGTDTTTGANLKIAASVNDPDNGFVFINLNVDDPKSNTTVLTSPLGFTLGVFSSLSPAEYLGNKPGGAGMGGFLSTEETGDLLGDDEKTQRQANGMLYFTDQREGMTGFGFAHGMASDGVSMLQEARMDAFLSRAIPLIVGPSIGELMDTQDPSIDDDTRKSIRLALDRFFNALKGAPGRKGMISGFTITMDASNNTSDTLGMGYVIAKIAVRYKGVVRVFYATLQGGSLVALAKAA